MYRKIMSLLLAAVVLLGFSGCRKEEKKSGKLNIVTTVFPLYDIARTVAGDKAEVTMLLPTGAEVHSYEPTPQDVIKIKKSDLFVNIGGSADPWTRAITEDSDINTLSAQDFAELVEEKTVEGMEEEKDKDEHGEIEYDEHVWTSPVNAAKIAEGIKNSLCNADAANSKYYEDNYTAFAAELKELDSEFEKTVESARTKTLVFADRFPMRYFTERYGLGYYAAFPGCSSETEPAASTVMFLIKKIKAEKIKIVLYTETSNQKMADTICEETGAEKMLFHSCHTVSKKELAEGASYISLMKKNLEVLKKALQ